ncbi:PIN domain-containing protein [Syntrophomonas curvata]
MRSEISFSGRLFLLALIFGIWAAYTVQQLLPLKPLWNLGLGIIAAVLFYLGFALLVRLARKAVAYMNRTLDSVPSDILLGGMAGLFMGILVGVLSTFPLSLLDGVGDFLTLGVFCLSGFLGATIGARRAPDFIKLFPHSTITEEASEALISPKVLDTSAIIDGRIYDVCLSHFLEGQLIVPTFVIEELQHIADSSDNIRRNKGRRGLELLSKMQKHTGIKIDIIEANIPEEKDVDNKLLRLCKQINACIITNDYNLNKVAELQGIKVLNINELTNAVKVIVYPGETMHISIIKEGKEAGQGVGYLEDGTMVVVEDAHHEIGNELEVMVTSVFQTAAGRMIFTRKVREENSSSVNHVFQEVQEVKLYG